MYIASIAAYSNQVNPRRQQFHCVANIEGCPEKRANGFDCPRVCNGWNKLDDFLSDANDASTWTQHVIFCYSPNLWHHVVQPDESQQTAACAFDECCGNFSISCGAETVWRGCWRKIDSSGVSKDWKIEVVHGLLEQRETRGDIASTSGGNSSRRDASLNSEVSQARCRRTA